MHDRHLMIVLTAPLNRLTDSRSLWVLGLVMLVGVWIDLFGISPDLSAESTCGLKMIAVQFVPAGRSHHIGLR